MLNFSKEKYLVIILLVCLFAFVIGTRICAIGYQGFVDDGADWVRGVRVLMQQQIEEARVLHGTLNCYSIKLGSVILGENFWGWRILNVAWSILLLVCVTYVVKKNLGKSTSLFCLLLLASNQMLIFYSNFVVEETLLLLLISIFILFFYEFIKTKRRADLIIFSVAYIFALWTCELKTIVALLVPLTYLAVNKSNRIIFVPKNFILVIGFVLLGVLPAVVWLSQNKAIADFIFEKYIHMPQNPSVLFKLFFGFILEKDNCIRDHLLGYNAVGAIEGVVLFVGLIASIKYVRSKKSDFVILMFIFCWTYVVVAVFAGDEPRHFMPILIPCSIFSSMLLEDLWKCRRTKGVISLLILTIMVSGARFSYSIPYYYSEHSKWIYENNGKEYKKDMNQAAREILLDIEEYDPTLSIFVDKEFDSLAYFVGAISGHKAVSSLMEDRILSKKGYFFDSRDEFKKILIFCINNEKCMKFRSWGIKNNYTHRAFRKITSFDKQFQLFVQVLLLTNEDKTVSHEAIDDFKKILFEETDSAHDRRK